MEPQKIVYNDANINVITKGNFKEKAIVFLHGNSLSNSSFVKQFELLDLPLVAIDLPGHGESDPANDPEKTYSIPGYVDAISSVINDLQLSNYILAGHSLGGHIAIEALPHLKNNAKGILIFGTPPLDAVTSIGSAFLPHPLFGLFLRILFLPKKQDSLQEVCCIKAILLKD